MSGGGHGGHPEEDQDDEAEEQAAHKHPAEKQAAKPEPQPQYYLQPRNFFDPDRPIRLVGAPKENAIAMVGTVAVGRWTGRTPGLKAAPSIGVPQHNTLVLAHAVQDLVNNPEYAALKTALGVRLGRGKEFDWHGDLKELFRGLKNQSVVAQVNGYEANNPWHEMLDLVKKHHDILSNSTAPHGLTPEHSEPEPDAKPDESPSGDGPKPSRGLLGVRSSKVSDMIAARFGRRQSSLYNEMTLPGQARRSSPGGLFGAMRAPSGPPGFGEPSGSILPPATAKKMKKLSLGEPGFMRDSAHPNRPSVQLVSPASERSDIGVFSPNGFGRLPSKQYSLNAGPVVGPSSVVEPTGPVALLQSLLGHHSLLESAKARSLIGRELDQLHSQDRQAGMGFSFFGFNPKYSGEQDGRAYQTFEKALGNVQNFQQVIARLSRPMSEQQTQALHAALVRGLLQHASKQGHSKWVASEFNDLAAEGHVRFESGGLKEAQGQLRNNVRAVEEKMVRNNGQPMRELVYGIRALRPTSGAIPANSHDYVHERFLTGLRRRLF